MAVPTLSHEDRQAALQKASQMRQERAAWKERIRQGMVRMRDLVDAATEDPKGPVGGMTVDAALKSVPRVGPSAALRIREQVAIPEGRRLRGLGARQRARLVELIDGDPVQ